MGSAKVSSVEALDDFKIVLTNFVETSREALSAVEMELHRFLDWLEHEQPAYWRKQIQLRREEITEARAALTRKQLSSISGSKPSLLEEKVAVKRAEARLGDAEEKLEKIRRWSVLARKAVDEYQVRARQLATLLEGDPPDCLTTLNKIRESIQEYMDLTAPTVEPIGRPPASSVARPVEATTPIDAATAASDTRQT